MTNTRQVAEAAKDAFSRGKEGPIARAIEKRTAKVPSDMFLWGAMAAMVTSAVIQGMSMKSRRMNRPMHRERSLFVGQWVPTLLILGLYNKLVKEFGSDRSDREKAA